MQSKDYVLTLAGFETLQLVKLSEMWSLWLGRASVFGNAPFIAVGTQGYFQSPLQLPSFVWKPAHQKMGCGAESGAGRHSCTAQGENEILTCTFCYLPGSQAVTAF